MQIHAEAECRSDDGITLFRRSWPAQDPRWLMLVVHGYAEHCGRYDRFGRWFAARGVHVEAYDQRGHGKSGGIRCHVDSFDQYLDDLDLMLRQVRAEHPELPLLLLGHSMGGLVVATFLRERSPELLGAITSSAALSLPDNFPKWRLWMAQLLRRVVPRVGMPSGLDATAVSRDPEVVRAYIADPLVESRMTTSLAMELFEAQHRAEGGGAGVKVPMLMLHAGTDRLVHPQGTRDFFKSVDVPGSELIIYPELYHEIFNEPEQESVFADVLAWIEERSPKPK